MQIAQCHRSEPVRLVWCDPIAGDLKMFSASCAQTGMQQEQGPLLVACGEEDWNETWAAKSPNLGPGFSGKQRSVKFTEFLTSVVQLPLCLHQGGVGYWLWERTTGLDEWSAVIQMWCFARFFAQNSTMRLRWQNWWVTLIFPCVTELHWHRLGWSNCFSLKTFNHPCNSAGVANRTKEKIVWGRKTWRQA